MKHSIEYIRLISEYPYRSHSAVNENDDTVRVELDIGKNRWTKNAKTSS